MLTMQALEKADKAKNSADKSVEIISTTMNTVDNILGLMGKYYNELVREECQKAQILYNKRCHTANLRRACWAVAEIVCLINLPRSLHFKTDVNDKSEFVWRCGIVLWRTSLATVWRWLRSPLNRNKLCMTNPPPVFAADAVQARSMPSCGVCVSVCLSRSRTLSKRINISSKFFHHCVTTPF